MAPRLTRDLSGARLRVLVPRQGPVATRGSVYTSGLSNGTDTSTTYLTKHTLLRDTGTIRLAYGNFYNNAGAETAGPNDIAVKVEIRLADSSVIPVTFGGQVTRTINPNGLATSDPVSVNQLAGAVISVVTYVSVTAGQKWPVGIATVTANGEGRTANADQTGGGAVTATAVFAYSPLQIVGDVPPGAPVLAGIGDSIMAGTGDSNTIGMFYRAFSGVLAEQRIAYPSESVNGFSQPRLSARRLPLIDCATHAICNLGVNDVKAGTAAATIEANLVKVWRAVAARGILVRQTTITPVTTSTDVWATTANQTVTANEAIRVALNTWLRAGAPLDAGTLAVVSAGTSGALIAGQPGHPLRAVVELADTVETARNSGIWQAGYTGDGTHPNATAATALAAVLAPLGATFQAELRS